MKKSIIILLSLVLSLSAFSCTHKKEYRVLEAGGLSDVSSDANHQTEIQLESKIYQKATPPENRTVSINGVDYEVQYEKSSESYYYYSEYDFYSSKEGDIHVQVGFNNVTEKMDLLLCLDFSLESGHPEEEKSQEECRRIATEFLGQFADPIGDYNLIFEKKSPLSNSADAYTFTFARIREGFETTDKAIIDVNNYGNVFGYSFLSFGEMKNCKAPSKSEMETIEQAVAAKLDQIYTLSDEFSYRHETQTVTLAKLKDGKCALIYDIKVTKQSGDGETTYYSELCKLVVPLD